MVIDVTGNVSRSRRRPRRRPSGRRAAHRRAARPSSAGPITYTPDLNFHGRDRFTYRVCDIAGRCDRATVTVTVISVGDPPVASDLSVSTGEDRPVVIDVMGSVVDPDGDLESVLGGRGPAHGRAVVSVARSGTRRI